MTWIALGSAAAEPSADLVVVWAPNANVAPVEAAARKAGAAPIDRSPPAATPPDTARLIHLGIQAYDALRLEDAMAALDRARDAVDKTGAAGITTAQLSDLFLYRALVRTQQEDTNGAWDELVMAATIEPARVLDPARFPPRVLADWERARTTLADRPHAQLAVDAPAGCTVEVDGGEPVTAVTIGGPHWVRATCPDRAPWGQRVVVVAPGTTLVASPAVLSPPSDADVLIQARSAGARAIVVAEAHGGTGTARLIGIDGHEQDRRTVVLRGDLAPLADAVSDLLVPTVVVHHHWYQSKWVYVAGAVAIAAAILIPTTAALAGGSPDHATVKPQGAP